MMGKSPKTEALAFRIWAHCQPLGWDTDVREIADHLGVSFQQVAGICRSKGWSNRLRVRYDGTYRVRLVTDSGAPANADFGMEYAQ